LNEEKSYEELEAELVAEEEAEEAAFRQEMMIKGECRWGRQAEGSACRLLKNGLCGEDGFPCSYRGKGSGKPCRKGYASKHCNFDYRGICGEDGEKCSRYE